jgi:hypothetical protein
MEFKPGDKVWSRWGFGEYVKGKIVGKLNDKEYLVRIGFFRGIWSRQADELSKR